MAVAAQTVVNDDGTGTTGTVWNAAFQLAFEAAINAALATYLPLAGGTITGDLKFTDGLYDIGKAGATRPRDGFFSRHLTVGGKLAVANSLAGDNVADLANTSATGFGPNIAAGGSDATHYLLNLANSGGGAMLRVGGTGLVQLFAYTGTTWVTGDKYLVVDASGNVHRSAIGPAS